MSRRRTAPPPKILHQTLPLGDGPATVAVVSDTHSHPHTGTWAQLAAEQPVAILHAGDVGAAQVLRDLEEVAPLYAVRGNIDERGHPDLPDVLVLDLTRGDQRLRVLLTHIAVRGPRLLPAARQLAAEHQADLLVCGHSHVPLLTRDGRVVVFNPGSVGPRRFNLPITWGALRFGPGGLKIGHMDCETGGRWMPPELPAA